MSSDKYQVSRCIAVIPTDNDANIQFPGAASISGTTNGTTAGELVNTALTSANNFVASGVKPGWFVHNTTDNTFTKVTGVKDNSLRLADDIMVSGETYVVYEPYTNYPVFYVGATGDVEVVTDGGDTILFTGVLGGTWMPVKIKKINATNTTATSIVATW